MLAELEAYWGVLRPGGALIGDDFAWKHVQAAVETLAERHPLDFTTEAPKWMFRKAREVAVVEGEKPALAVA